MTGKEYTEAITDHLRDAYLLSAEKIEEVLPRFLDTLLSHLDNLDHPLQTDNLQQLGKAGHTLKGALLNLGLLDLADLAFRIEQQCGAEDTTADYAVLVRQLQQEIRSFAVRQQG